MNNTGYHELPTHENNEHHTKATMISTKTQKHYF